MDQTLELDTLRERDDVTVETETRTVTRPEFDTARDLEDHVTLGLVNDRDAVLLIADGPRGWTLPATPVDPDDDWTAAAERLAESLTDVRITIEEPVRLREVTFRLEDGERSVTSADVLVTGTVTGQPVADEPTVAGETVQEVAWLDRLPDGAADALERDVRSLRE
ncbi:NUDIX domain-containing protein [Halopiger goleimassiliensis]|uniref:NUDIX domain-containing protein n=1 Tax=Halopiger goleimassiliensis TaxID=1293048 RepID=UPI00067772E1|nr:NUDIX domain-containing protein [Halopiger goleimassiliensis]